MKDPTPAPFRADFCIHLHPVAMAALYFYPINEKRFKEILVGIEKMELRRAANSSKSDR